MRNPSRALSLSALFLCAVAATAQQKPSDRLISARSLYYMPTTSGLKSFHCAVAFDWKVFLNNFSKTPIGDDNPALVYLKTTKLSVIDDLNGKGEFVWTDTTVPPEAFADGSTKMQGGMRQMFDAYFQSWNAYMNGSMVPVPDDSLAVTADGEGVQVRGLLPNQTLTEKFDKNMVLTETHVVDASTDEYDYPVFTNTPDGRMLTSIHTISKEPPTAPASVLDIVTTYAKVGAFQLPATVKFSVKDVGDFLFTFNTCEVIKK
jgi:hypothetical protein